MARNQFTWITGKLTKDAKTHTFDSGAVKVSFTVAVERDKKPDEERAKADFIPVITWKKLAEKCKDLRKGDLVSVVGSIQTGSYDGKQGKVYTTELLAEKVFLDGIKKPVANTGDDIFGDSDEGFTPLDDGSDLPFA